jgi:hypothetical protein
VIGKQKWLTRAATNLAKHDFCALPDPARTIAIDPASVSRLARIHLATKQSLGNKLHDFGRIIEGDWDRVYDGRPNPLITDGLTHSSAVLRYVEGVPWEETPRFSRCLRVISEGGKIDNCRTREDLVDRYRRLDEIYADMQRNGYLVERLQRFENTIFVSVDRDGSFLLGQGGKHRLAISIILGLTRIEVFVLSRHLHWQEMRERAFASGAPFDHPDLLEFT